MEHSCSTIVFWIAIALADICTFSVITKLAEEDKQFDDSRLLLLSAQDAWIAATAVRHDLPLVTNNAKDFQNIQKLQVITLQ